MNPFEEIYLKKSKEESEKASAKKEFQQSVKKGEKFLSGRVQDQKNIKRYRDLLGQMDFLKNKKDALSQGGLFGRSYEQYADMVQMYLGKNKIDQSPEEAFRLYQALEKESSGLKSDLESKNYDLSEVEFNKPTPVSSGEPPSDQEPSFLQKIGQEIEEFQTRKQDDFWENIDDRINEYRASGGADHAWLPRAGYGSHLTANKIKQAELDMKKHDEYLKAHPILGTAYEYTPWGQKKLADDLIAMQVGQRKQALELGVAQQDLRKGIDELTAKTGAVAGGISQQRQEATALKSQMTSLGSDIEKTLAQAKASTAQQQADLAQSRMEAANREAEFAQSQAQMQPAMEAQASARAADQAVAEEDFAKRKAQAVQQGHLEAQQNMARMEEAARKKVMAEEEQAIKDKEAAQRQSRIDEIHSKYVQPEPQAEQARPDIKEEYARRYRAALAGTYGTR